MITCCNFSFSNASVSLTKSEISGFNKLLFKFRTGMNSINIRNTFLICLKNKFWDILTFIETIIKKRNWKIDQTSYWVRNNCQSFSFSYNTNNEYTRLWFAFLIILFMKSKRSLHCLQAVEKTLSQIFW